MESIPYLLAVDDLNERILKKFNSLKQKEDPTFVPLEGTWEISYSRSEFRADTLWSSLVPKEKEGISFSTSRYVMIPLEMVPYVVIREYDGSETYHIDYNKYGIAKIQTILAKIDNTEKLAAIQTVIDTIVKKV